MWLGAAIALAVSLALTPAAQKLAIQVDAVSRPDGKRRLQSRPIPVWGGLAVCVAVVLGLVAAHSLDSSAQSYTTFLAALGVSAGLVCLLGCYDDLRDMDARWKLVGQIAATVPIVAAGFWVDHLTIFGHSLHLGWLGVPWTFAWLILGMNALNLIDGMDGLASSIGIVISLAIACIAATHDMYGVMVLSLTFVGALTGFLVYNSPPAHIYLGDCGSMLTGLVLSSLALVVSFEQPGTVSLTVAAALLFVPLLDTALAILRRTLQGGSFMAADRGHVHHRLLDRGFGVWQALGFLAGLSVVASSMAWMTSRTGHELITWLALGALMAVMVRSRLMGHEEWALVLRFASHSIAPRITGPVLRRLGDTRSQPKADLAARTDTSPKSRDFAITLPFVEEKTARESTSDAPQPSSPTKAA
jgi:UDP-GlcNAc:undecaprenyl-phosphate GlcNAc-1-phosphate transferase